MSNFYNTWDNYNVFWMTGAAVIIVFIIAMNIPNGDKVEFAKAGLEECPDTRGSMGTIWVKDCVRTTMYLKENKVLPKPEVSTSLSKY